MGKPPLNGMEVVVDTRNQEGLMVEALLEEKSEILNGEKPSQTRETVVAHLLVHESPLSPDRIPVIKLKI